MSGDYEVGYKKPPVKNRFKPGNQAARSRRNRTDKPTGLSLAAILEKALRSNRKIKRGDHVIDMPVAEILVERLVQTITSGNARDLKMIMDLVQQHAPHVLAAPVERFAVRYHRAEGSSVPLPSIDQWHEEKR
jgi:hypothetical protein